jgi:hypothetical protein
MNTTNKCTPGPWLKGYEGGITTTNKEDVLEYGGCGSHELQWNNPADYTLALAAPDLLKTCEHLYSQYYDSLSQNSIELVSKAIAKAKGSI